VHKIVSWLLAGVGVAAVTVAPAESYAANLTTLVSFCALANCADGSNPAASLIDFDRLAVPQG
jgi:hypothetical protein